MTLIALALIVTEEEKFYDDDDFLIKIKKAFRDLSQLTISLMLLMLLVLIPKCIKHMKLHLIHGFNIGSGSEGCETNMT